MRDSILTKRIRGGGIRRDFKKNRALYVMILPVLAFFIVFCYFPMGGILMAFQDYDVINGLFGSDFVGIIHFQRFFADPFFGRLLRNTLMFSLWDILIAFPAPLLLALLLNSAFHKIFKRSIQTVVYLPYFISMVVVCGIVRMLFSETGVIAALFQQMGLLKEGSSMLGDLRYFRGIIVASNVWSSMGFNSVIYIAALAGIDESLYESAEIDGAGRWKKFWHVTFPSILPTIMMLLIFKVSSLLNVNFEKIHLLYTPSLYEKADVLTTYIYRLGIEGAQYSYSAAVGLFNSVAGFSLLLVSNFISRRVTKSGLF